MTVTEVATPELREDIVTFESEEHLETFIRSRLTVDEDVLLPELSFESYAEAVEAHFIELENLPEDVNPVDRIDETLVYLDEQLEEIRPLIPLGSMAQLINRNGDIAIGSDVHHYEGETVTVTHFASVDHVNPLSTESVEVEYKILGSTEDASPSSELSNRGFGEACKVTDGKHRMKGESQFNRFIGYSENRVVTKHQRRRWGVWHRDVADDLAVGGLMTARISDCTGLTGQTFYQNDCDDFEARASSCDCIVSRDKPCVDNATYYDSYHRAVLNSSSRLRASCTNSIFDN